MREIIPKPIIPKEHGAWAILVVPLFIGASVAGVWTPDFILLALSSLCFFMSYVPAQMLLRHWLVRPQPENKVQQASFWLTVYILCGLTLSMPLLMRGYFLLLAIGGIGTAVFAASFLVTRRFPKTIPGDLLAVCGLTLTAPASYYIGAGILDGNALALWLFNVLFFGSGVFYVHMKIRATTSKQTEPSLAGKISLGKLNILYHLAAIGIVVGMAVYQDSMRFAVIAFVPMLLHALYGTYRLSTRVHFKNLGFLLLGQSIIFGVLLWGVVRW